MAPPKDPKALENEKWISFVASILLKSLVTEELDMVILISSIENTVESSMVRRLNSSTT